MAAQLHVRAAGQQAVVPHSRPWITDADREAVRAALDSMMIAEAELTRRLEDEAAAYLGQAGGVATPDGTTALYLALLALDVGPGDEVVIPIYVCEAVERAVRWTGATPALADVGDDWCVDAATVQRAVTKRTRAVVVPHTFGIVADTAAIAALGVPVIEDLAQAFGAAPVTSELSITSFHATKCLTTGEGGMAFAREPTLLTRLQDIKTTRHRAPLPNLGAALGLSQLGRYGEFLARRREIAARYANAIPERFLPAASVLERTMHFRFPLRVDRDVAQLMAAYAERGVLAKRGVDALLHGQSGEFPGAESAFAHTISLPIHPSMSEDDVGRVIGASHEVLGR